MAAIQLPKKSKDDLYCIDGENNVFVANKVAEMSSVSPKKVTMFFYVCKEKNASFHLYEEEFLKDEPKSVDGYVLCNKAKTARTYLKNSLKNN